MAAGIILNDSSHRLFSGSGYLLFCLVLISVILVSCKNEDLPVVTTAGVTSITTTSATSGGTVTDDGGAKITERGICWNTSGNPTLADSKTSDGTGTGTFSSSLKYLKPDTYYTLRAYAINRAGTGYGEEKSFVTLKITIGSVNDVDGNTYKTVRIGSQTWMAENLRTTKYNDNTPIPKIVNNATWSTLNSPAYCWYNNDSAKYRSPYGALYNWYTITTRKICPSGWRVPSDAEWTILSDYLGGEILAGDKLKETGDSHWVVTSGAITNETGFTAVPGGARIEGIFGYLGKACAFWSSTEYDTKNAWCRELDDDKVELLRGSLVKTQGFSIRCMQD